MSKNDSNKTDMLHGSPGMAMLLFAVPMILGNIFQQLYNIMDFVIVGRYVGELPLIRLQMFLLPLQSAEESAVWWAIPMGWSANYLISFCRYLTGKWKAIRQV